MTHFKLFDIIDDNLSVDSTTYTVWIDWVLTECNRFYRFSVCGQNASELTGDIIGIEHTALKISRDNNVASWVECETINWGFMEHGLLALVFRFYHGHAFLLYWGPDTDAHVSA